MKILILLGKILKYSFCKKNNQDALLLWKCNAPECVLNSLGNIQVADSLRSWYIYREQATKECYGHKFSDLSSCQSLWYNKLIRSKMEEWSVEIILAGDGRILW